MYQSNDENWFRMDMRLFVDIQVGIEIFECRSWSSWHNQQSLNYYSLSLIIRKGMDLIFLSFLIPFIVPYSISWFTDNTIPPSFASPLFLRSNTYRSFLTKSLISRIIIHLQRTEVQFNRIQSILEFCSSWVSSLWWMWSGIGLLSSIWKAFLI